MKFDLISLIRKFLNFLCQTPPIGGLEISDLSIRFSVFKNGILYTNSLKLPPGILEDGKIKNKNLFIQALQKFHTQVNFEVNGKDAKVNEKVFVIISFPYADVYTQIFSIPSVSEEKIEEAATLNLKMISPVDINTAYYDWQRIGKDEENNQIEILGAFISSNIVDEFLGSLEAANFSVIATEFPSLSLVRTLKDLGVNKNIEASTIILNVSSVGLEFIIVKNTNLYFNYFVSWKSIQGDARQIPFPVFQDAIIKNFQQVLNFYSTHWKDKVAQVFVLSISLAPQIIEVISKNFYLPTSEFKINKFDKLSSEWFVSLGGALRGNLPREKDVFISLMSVGTEEKLKNNQTKAFFNFWRNIAISSFGFLVVIFLFSSVFLSVSHGNMKDQISVDFDKTKTFTEVNQLKNQAAEFNNLISLTKKAQQGKIVWTTFFDKINTLADKSGVTIDRIFFQSIEAPILINGIAKSDKDAINFKKALSEQSEFNQVTLPLSNLKLAGEGISFSINFSLKSLNN